MSSPAPSILSGFKDPVLQAQQTFRDVLQAMSYPGRIVNLDNIPAGPKPLSAATTAVCLSLLDFETTVWLDQPMPMVADYLKFHCSCPISNNSHTAHFALITHATKLNNLSQFNLGSHDYPDRSATLVIQVADLANTPGATLSGPGIEQTTTLSVSGVHENFWQQVQHNHSLFPRGVDLILTCGKQLAALPRSIQVGA